MYLTFQLKKFSGKFSIIETRYRYFSSEILLPSAEISIFFIRAFNLVFPASFLPCSCTGLAACLISSVFTIFVFVFSDGLQISSEAKAETEEQELLLSSSASITYSVFSVFSVFFVFSRAFCK